MVWLMKARLVLYGLPRPAAYLASRSRTAQLCPGKSCYPPIALRLPKHIAQYDSADGVVFIITKHCFLPSSTSMISKVLFLVEQIRPRTAQVDDLWTPISILLQSRTFEAVEGV